VTDRLYRHPTDRVIAGVAGGLAVWLNVDPSLVRIAWVLLALLSGGAFVIVYIVMMIVVPLPPPGWIPRPRGSMGPGPGAAPGWQPGGAWDTGWTGSPGSPPPASGPAGPGGPPVGSAGSWSSGPADPGWSTPPGSSTPATPARPGNAGIIAGIVLVVLGIWFLVDQYVRIDWNLLWPVVIMVAGGGLIAWAMLRGRPG
jgi:phage shock protein C